MVTCCGNFIVSSKTEHETRWKGHSKVLVHPEWNKCETIEKGVQESRNICKSENNKNNKTIRNIWVQKGNPNGEVKARVYCNLVQGYSLGFGVQSLMFRVQSLMFGVWSLMFRVWSLHVSSDVPGPAQSREPAEAGPD